MKSTAIAHPNLAFIKYWGRKDEILRLPTNGSLSINLSGCTTTTTVEFSENYGHDSVIIDDENKFDDAERVIKHLDRIRKLAGIDLKAKVVSKNNFPSGTGLSSSASGFAALTLAGTTSTGLSLSEKDLSILARQGSGSACRSIPNGFAEWVDGNTSEDSYAKSLFPADYWDIVDVVAVVSTEKKDVPTSVGQTYARTSPFFEIRNVHMADKLNQAKQLIEDRNFSEFGQLIEVEALEMHAVMITSTPSLIYWSTGTLQLMKEIQSWRKNGVSAYFTINTGQDIHILAEGKNANEVNSRLSHLSYVKKIINNNVSDGVKIIDSHLF